jgi:aspartate/methionine/tyrosine aminotransferase
MADMAARHDLAIISDEVFSDLLLTQDAFTRPATSDAPLVITLNGFSKMFALPGMKFGWAAVTGRQDLVIRSLRSLELISDTFLPVNEIVQEAAAPIFQVGQAFQPSYVEELRARYQLLRRFLLEGATLNFVEPGGGFYLTLRLDGNEDRIAEMILQEARMLVHPGHYYDIEGDHLVLSFCQRPEAIRSALPRMLDLLARDSGDYPQSNAT